MTAELKESHIEHLKKCDLDDCVRCLYLRQGCVWRKKLPWLMDQLWKDMTADNGLAWGLGCRICIRAKLDKTSAFVRGGFSGRACFHHVQRHEKSKAHQDSLKYIKGDSDGAAGAPSKDQFTQFMAERLLAFLILTLSVFLSLG